MSGLPYAAVAVAGTTVGLSQLVGGAYDESTWSPIALVVLALLLAYAVGAPRPAPAAAVLTLLGLAAWSLISSGWGDSTDAAWTAGDRWLLYAASLAFLIRLVAGERRRGELLLGCAALACVGVMVGMLVQMLRGHGATLFLGDRLNDPLGYVDGQAGYLLAGVWPCCALAERRKPAVVAGLGCGLLVALVAVGALTRSRSWEIALVASALVLAVAISGRRRRIGILLVGAAAIFAIRHRLSAVSDHGIATEAAIRHAAVAILVVSVLAGVAWGTTVWLLERLAAPGTRRRGRIGRLVAGALVVLALAACAALAVNGARISRTARDQFHAFTHLSPSTSLNSDRLLSGAGNRYDYWRVAWIEFRSEPLRGVGAGNYQPGYYRDRRTTEAIEQPHSVELQTLAELGIVGAVLLAVFLGLIGLGVRSAARRARDEPAARPLAVAATGIFLAWLLQTSADWEHLIPGLTIMALAAGAVLLSTTQGSRAGTTPRGRACLIGAYAVLACAGALVIVPRVLTLRAQSDAQRALQNNDPRAAIRDATRALQYDGSSVPALVLRSAGLARADAFVPARNDLRRALAIEPHNWVTYALMGDLLTRRGELRAAHSFYLKAHAMDPLEPSLLAALRPPPK